MTNKLALFLGFLIIAGLTVDFVYNDGSGTLFIARKLNDLIEWMAFWR